MSLSAVLSAPGSLVVYLFLQSFLCSFRQTTLVTRKLKIAVWTKGSETELQPLPPRHGLILHICRFREHI